MSVAELAKSLAHAIRATPHHGPIETDPLGVLDRLGVAPDPWQAEYLTSSASERILFSCRQAGKTEMSALGALLDCALRPKTFSPIVATRLDQAAILVRRARDWVDRIREARFRLPAMPVPQPRYSSLHLEFENGSRLQAFPASESAARGETATGRVTVDEAARVPDEVFTAMMPQRAITETPLAMLTSAWYKSGRFFEMYTTPPPEGVARSVWRVVAPVEYGRKLGVDLTGLESSGLESPPDVEIQVCTRMTWAGFVSAVAGMTHVEIRREMYGIFSDERLDSVFAHAAVQAALSHELQPLWPEDTVSGRRTDDEDAVLPLFTG